MSPKARAPIAANPRNSVLFTQVQVSSAEVELRQAVLKVKDCQDKLDRLKQQHREQIARSLESPFDEERQMAHSVAAWWEIPLPEKK